MEKSKIAMMLEKEMEPIKKMCEPLEEAVKHELSKGIENVDAKELGEVVDMIKDLYEAKEKLDEADIRLVLIDMSYKLNRASTPYLNIEDSPSPARDVI